MKYLLLIVLVQAFGACSRPIPPASTAAASPSLGLRDPYSVSDPAEQQRIRDENTRHHQHWNYQPAERNAYRP